MSGSCINHGTGGSGSCIHHRMLSAGCRRQSEGWVDKVSVVALGRVEARTYGNVRQHSMTMTIIVLRVGVMRQCHVTVAVTTATDKLIIIIFIFIIIMVTCTPTSQTELCTFKRIKYSKQTTQTRLNSELKPNTNCQVTCQLHST